MSETVPMTPEGHRRLQEELKHLIRVERPKVIQDIAEARGHGDLSENAEYDAAKERQGFVEGRISEINGKMARAQVIDIADIDVGDNIGAHLQASRAEAVMHAARAKAEGRRAMAVAEEQENTAHIEESRAKVVQAEAEVPKAIAAAFEGGQLSIMDYYRLKNIQADTSMRDNIAQPGPEQNPTGGSGS